MQIKKNLQFLTGLILLVLAVDRQLLAVPTCEQAVQAMNQASVIRGLRIKAKVPCLIHDKAQVEGYIRGHISEVAPTEKLKGEELAFKALGLIPEDFDYVGGIVELYLSQLGGYYDPKRKHFVMAGWMPESMQPTIAAHELTHALQDQYYDINKLIDHKVGNSDQLLSRSALLEGDATAVMIDFNSAPGTVASMPNVDALMINTVVGSTIFSGGATVPPALMQILIFPYTSGLRFVHQKIKGRGYDALDGIYKRPPSTTEEILHPEKYGKGSSEYKTFLVSDIKHKDMSTEASIMYEDTWGEFVISVLLAAQIEDRSKAVVAANGWGGDRLALFKDGEEIRLVWRTGWDTSKDAQEFAAVLEEALLKKYQKKAEEFSFKKCTDFCPLSNNWSARASQPKPKEWTLEMRKQIAPQPLPKKTK